MNVRLKKLLGTFVIVTFLSVYCLLAMVVAVNVLPGTGGLTQLAYYVVAGFLWVVPVAMLITWMQRPG